MKNKKQYQWDRLNTYSITLKLNNNTDKEIIKKLQEKDNKQKYIKELIKYNYKDKFLTAKEICKITGLKLSGFYSRLNRNWSIERIVETKVNDYRVNK